MVPVGFTDRTSTQLKLKLGLNLLTAGIDKILVLKGQDVRSANGVLTFPSFLLTAQILSSRPPPHEPRLFHHGALMNAFSIQISFTTLVGKYSLTVESL